MAVIVHRSSWGLQPPPTARINTSHPLAAGLAIAYHSQSGGTVLFDQHGGWYPLALTNTLAGWRSTAVGMSPDYNPANSTWFQGPVSLTAGARLSVEAWVIPDTFNTDGSGNESYLRNICRVYKDDVAHCWDLRFGDGTLANNAKPCFALYAGVSWQTVLSTLDATAGKLLHLVATYDGVNIKLYQDSVLVDDLDYSSTPSFTGTFRIGASAPERVAGAVNRFMDGAVPLARVWSSRTLSASDVQWLYAEPYAMLASPRRYWVLSTTTSTRTIATATSSLAWRFGRPESDVAAGSWTASPLWDKVNEA